MPSQDQHRWTVTATCLARYYARAALLQGQARRSTAEERATRWYDFSFLTAPRSSCVCCCVSEVLHEGTLCSPMLIHSGSHNDHDASVHTASTASSSSFLGLLRNPKTVRETGLRGLGAFPLVARGLRRPTRMHGHWRLKDCLLGLKI